MLYDYGNIYTYVIAQLGKYLPLCTLEDVIHGLMDDVTRGCDHYLPNIFSDSVCIGLWHTCSVLADYEDRACIGSTPGDKCRKE